MTSDGTFKELRKVSHANPQQDKLLWGSSEVVHYKNADGVALSAALIQACQFRSEEEVSDNGLHLREAHAEREAFRTPAPGTNINISYYTSNGYLVLSPISSTPSGIRARAR